MKIIGIKRRRIIEDTEYREMWKTLKFKTDECLQLIRLEQSSDKFNSGAIAALESVLEYIEGLERGEM